ncbi:nitric oxide synthase [Rhodoblastus sphagnicola]|uniref:NADPH--hemoprotein reductase n=1 Tax=Rhodoblastus sphagnicola TaxID=333368 RepID=A0A2S6NDT7_9HYPH|nr:PepSY domain-containing protein [Rhodoblastus sphagnicola]MBB4198521.1 sulfite reductase (NADPH) flavoprotein alpha-component [Rhodoblastus sphagnicola]PPQ32763.1 nitric oxide synthase [Rhodoblastus sphagnicola]
MLRRLHSVAGLALALLLVAIAATGVGLSLQPAVDRLAAPAIAPGVSVAALAKAVAARHQRVDAIRVSGGGAVTVSFNDGAGKQVEIVDPRTGAGLGAYRPSETFRWLADMHRSLLMGDSGRIAVALSALGLLALSLTGAVMLARSLGGAGALLRPVRGGAARRWHGELGRLALAGLLLSALTGTFLSATTFGLLPGAENPAPAVAAKGGPAAPVGRLAGLAAVDVADLERLTFPARNDPTDVFTLRQSRGEAVVDPSTGRILAFTPTSTMDRIGRLANALHTGRFSWAFALFLGLSTAAAPVLGATGFLMWRRRRATPRVIAPAPTADADTVILVGSEGGSTWGFAQTLSRALSEAGQRVSLAAMDDIDNAHLRAQKLVILAATYGDGDAPASAKKFLEKLGGLERRIPVAVLGFGDRTFPSFCGYAERVVAALDAQGWPRLIAPKRIDRQSAQEFAQWGRDLGAALGCALTLEHVAEPPKTNAFALVGRETYGEAVGAPVAILRFASPGNAPRFEAGDLVGIVPPGSAMPRFYSLVSSRRDGVLEICVRLQPGGLCSTWLHSLKAGEQIEAFIRDNPSFRPVEGRAPLILIGAGAGIAPLAGFVRANDSERPMHLYWGGRSAASDFLYEHELAERLAQRRLTSLRTAFSRHPADAAYVQDRVADDAHRLRVLIRAEAQILVCGGRDMARAVAETIEAVVRPLGLDLATLKSNGRYLEDVY